MYDFISEFEVVCECFIDGEWLVYTEVIDKGFSPLSRWSDLKYLGEGESSKIRCTKSSVWVSENSHRIIDL